MSEFKKIKETYLNELKEVLADLRCLKAHEDRINKQKIFISKVKKIKTLQELHKVMEN